ncbi:hypothetical protein QZH41_009639, partial [Actinostola sp. cb2023]
NWMQSPPDVYPTCVVCSRILYLIAQIYCPLYNAEHHRTLYMFGCANPLCWNKSKRPLRNTALLMIGVKMQQIGENTSGVVHLCQYQMLNHQTSLLANIVVRNR